MTADDLAAIREALPGDADPRCRCRECVDRRKALAALDRIEADTLTPKQASAILGGLWAIAPDGWLEIREVVDRIANEKENN